MKNTKAKNQVLMIILLITGIVLFDQIVKYFAVTYISGPPVKSMSLIPGFMNVTYVENTGMAFGAFSNNAVLLGVINSAMVAVLIVLLYKYKDMASRLFRLSVCFIIGGAIGNIIDRFFRGFVVDMLKFSFGNYVFNIADAFVCTGSVLLGVFVISLWVREKKQKDASCDVTSE